MEPRRSTESRCNNNRVEEKAVVVNNRGAWTAEEDMKLAQYVEIHGPKRWKTAAVKAGLNRCGKSCRLRWLNYLRPNIKRGNITEAEEDLIVRLHKLLGNRWSLIAGRLPGRTDNEIKNYWNSHLSKKIKQRRRNKKPEQSHQQQETMSKTPTPPPPLDDVVTSAQEWEEEEEVKRNKESEMMKEDGSKENDYDLLAEISFDVDDLFATDHHQGIYCNNNSGGGLDKWLNDEFVDLDDSVDSSMMMMNGWLWSNNSSTDDSYYCM